MHCPCFIFLFHQHSSYVHVADNVEVTNFNWPKDRVFDWLLGPLLLIKDQMRKLEITEDEEMCLRKLIMTNKNEKPSDWDDSGFPSDDNIKRGQLQAIIRRYNRTSASLFPHAILSTINKPEATPSNKPIYS